MQFVAGRAGCLQGVGENVCLVRVFHVSIEAVYYEAVKCPNGCLLNANFTLTLSSSLGDIFRTREPVASKAMIHKTSCSLSDVLFVLTMLYNLTLYVY